MVYSTVFELVAEKINPSVCLVLKEREMELRRRERWERRACSRWNCERLDGHAWKRG
jgi:hypothetical protein